MTPGHSGCYNVKHHLHVCYSAAPACMTPGHAAVYGAGEIGHYYVQADSFHATILSTLHPVIRDKEALHK